MVGARFDTSNHEPGEAQLTLVFPSHLAICGVMAVVKVKWFHLGCMEDKVVAKVNMVEKIEDNLPEVGMTIEVDLLAVTISKIILKPTRSSYVL